MNVVKKTFTLLYDPDPVLCHPLACFVSFGLGISCHIFSIIQLGSEGQIPVILPKKKPQKETWHQDWKLIYQKWSWKIIAELYFIYFNLKAIFHYIKEKRGKELEINTIPEEYESTRVRKKIILTRCDFCKFSNLKIIMQGSEIHIVVAFPLRLTFFLCYYKFTNMERLLFLTIVWDTL